MFPGKHLVPFGGVFWHLLGGCLYVAQAGTPPSYLPLHEKSTYMAERAYRKNMYGFLPFFFVWQVVSAHILGLRVRRLTKVV